MFTLKNIKADDKIKSTVDQSIKCLIDNNDVLSELNIDIQKSILFLAQTCIKKENIKIKLDNPFKLAGLFLPKNDVRFYLNYIYSNGEYLIASTGHILIRIKYQTEPGFYNKSGILCENSDFARYPDFSKVIDAKKIKNIDINSGVESIEKWGKINRYVIDFEDSRYQSEYINILKKLNIATFKLCKLSNAAYFSKDNFDGLIMPIRK